LLICLLGINFGFGIVPSAARGATVLVRGPRWPPAPVVAFAATPVASAAAAVLPLVELSVGKFSATWLIFSPLYKYRDIIYVCIYEYILSFFILVSIVPTLQSIFFYFCRRPYSNIIIQGQLTTGYQDKDQSCRTGAHGLGLTTPCPVPAYSLVLATDSQLLLLFLLII
jgi:hypothetical protein